jgi:hypothetical protein
MGMWNLDVFNLVSHNFVENRDVIFHHVLYCRQRKWEILTLTLLQRNSVQMSNFSPNIACVGSFESINMNVGVHSLHQYEVEGPIDHDNDEALEEFHHGPLVP